MNKPHCHQWRPALTERVTYAHTPPVGELIGADHRIWRVLSVERTNPGNWTDHDTEEWERTGRPDPETWARAPMRVTAIPAGNNDDDKDRRYGMTIGARYRITPWYVVPEHYAVCAECGEPSPCRDYEDALTARAEIARAAEALALPDGFCPACREPITSRQNAHRFPGGNLLNPFGSPVVRFHARRKCARAAAEYEEQWVAADPTRPRSLLTLRCAGSLIVHADGTAECHGADNCPTVYARHSRTTACYLQSHGCGRQCPREGHPGVRLARGLTPGGSTG